MMKKIVIATMASLFGLLVFLPANASAYWGWHREYRPFFESEVVVPPPVYTREYITSEPVFDDEIVEHSFVEREYVPPVYSEEIITPAPVFRSWRPAPRPIVGGGLDVFLGF